MILKDLLSMYEKIFTNEKNVDCIHLEGFKMQIIII